MKYEKATAEVVMFDNSDVITTSGGCSNGSGSGQNCGQWGGWSYHICINAPGQ